MNVQLGRIRKDRTLQKWYTILAFFCRGWDKPQTKGMWGHAWDLNRHFLNTWLKCYCCTRLVCVENIVLHKTSIKVTGVACNVQTEVWSWYLFMMYNQTLQQTEKYIYIYILPTKCTGLIFWHVSAIESSHLLGVKVKVKQSRYRPGVAQRVPGS